MVIIIIIVFILIIILIISTLGLGTLTNGLFCQRLVRERRIAPSIFQWQLSVTANERPDHVDNDDHDGGDDHHHDDDDHHHHRHDYEDHYDDDNDGDFDDPRVPKGERSQLEVLVLYNSIQFLFTFEYSDQRMM